jgi:hypothetical protein
MFRIDARQVASELTGRALGLAGPARAHLTCRARLAAGSAVFGVAHQVDARSIAPCEAGRALLLAFASDAAAGGVGGVAATGLAVATMIAIARHIDADVAAELEAGGARDSTGALAAGGVTIQGIFAACVTGAAV